MLVKKEWEDGLLLLKLNRPERLNALHIDLVKEILDALSESAENDDVNVIILASVAEKAFCTGVDIKYVESLTNEEAAHFFVEVAKLLEMLIDFPKVTIAAVNGYAHGGGADLALSCDIRIGGTSSSFRFPGPQFGLILGTKRLIDEIGSSRARFLTMTNEKIDAMQALDYGLLHEVTRDDEVLHRAIERGKALACLPKKTVRDLKRFTNGAALEASVESTRNSVLEGDFKQRFSAYVERIRRKNKQ